MLLESIIPHLPTSLAEIFIYVGAYLGVVFMIYSVFIEQEHRQDIIRILGSGGLLIYAMYIDNLLFIIAMAGIGLASLIEFVEILIGLHKHSKEDLKKYKTLWRIERKK